MAENDNNEQRADKIGNVLSIIFLVCLAAFFLYGYLPRFLG
jgi:hypothetical protein